MPYINQTERSMLDPRKLEGITFPTKAGELQFVIACYIERFIKHGNGLSYQTINDIVGALEGAKLEFYRRVAAPYENDKCEENGDVY